MGALAALLEPRYDGRSRVVTPPAWTARRVVTRGLERHVVTRELAALGGSYFSAAVAARGWPSPYEDLIAQAAGETGVDPHLIRAIISAESAWRPDVCSNRPVPPGSCGLMQLNVDAHRITAGQALDPGFNIPFATRLLADQLRRRPSLVLALAAYNAGTSRTDADLEDRVQRNVNGVGTYAQTVVEYLTWYQTQQAGTAPAPPPEAAAWGEESPTWWEEPSLELTETIAAVEPWMWWALGGAVVLGVALVVVVRRRGR